MSQSPRFSLRTWPAALQWLALLTAAGTGGWLLGHLGLPAAWFLGPMLVAVAFGVGGATIHMPRPAFKLGQGCVGILVAQSMTLSVLLALAQSWHVMLVATALTLALSLLVSLGLVWFGGISGSTAAWGMAPGAASAMVAMAEEDGADGRVVATMQYVRVGGVLRLGLPEWLPPLAYGAIGCYIGLRFDLATLSHVWRRLPAMIVGAVVLIVLCALSAWLIALLLGKDFLSVYLATTPGGLDAMAIIAVDTRSDAGLVLAMQTLRLFGVILTGAFFARQIMRLAQR
ncbi:AbrB family transcriptional regulator [Azotobacter salinestris]|uniref:AbrB family transcriptional regulator n=1 Tax=Azotobacter salinestris TaxID=69964 RepID=UPI001266BFF5|nr:AbrB family transcriptional regulator [Azotobacter salinestris]